MAATTPLVPNAMQALLATEAFRIKQHARSATAKRLSKTRLKILAGLDSIQAAGHLPTLVRVEKIILENDRKHHTNSKGMAASLNAALKELAVIESLLPIVADQVQYQLANKFYSLPKNRENDLPFDEARQAFRSHVARLNNLDRARLSTDEKAIIDARRNNIQTACALYALQQTQTLGKIETSVQPG